MPDHLHSLISLPRDEDLSKIIPGWKRFTARDAGIHWQSSFFDHRIRSDEATIQSFTTDGKNVEAAP